MSELFPQKTLINFGGQWLTYAEIWQWFKDNGCPPYAFDRWMQGYEVSLRARLKRLGEKQD